MVEKKVGQYIWISYDVRESGELYIKVKGNGQKVYRGEEISISPNKELKNQDNSHKGKIRITVIFSDGEKDRRFPLGLEQDKDSNFQGDEKISLGNVFLHGTNKENVNVSLELECNGERNQWEVCSLSGKYFQKQQEEETFHPVREKFSAIFAIILLPFLLVEGFLAVKGVGRLRLEGKRATGKKAIIFHANNRIQQLTGFTFSIREHKTRYFARCYKKYAKLPCVPNQILCLSERKLESGGNLDRVMKELEKKPQVTLVKFILEKPVNKLNRKELRKSAKLSAQSEMILLEDFYPQLHAISVRKETKVVQLWHACGAFKTFGFSRLGKVGGPRQDSKNHRNYDYVFVSSESMIPFYSEAFAIPESHVKALGVPRTDLFFEEGIREKKKGELYQQYLQLKGKKIVVFAPTFRGDGNKDAYYPREKFKVDDIMEKLPEEYFLVIKNHPFVKTDFAVSEKYQSRVLQCHKDIQLNDLLFLTDVLITDYSSSVFEAAILQVPTIFYAFDRDVYLKERDIYGDFDTFATGSIVTNQEELTEEIIKVVEREQREPLSEFSKYYLSAIDGHSTERICDFIVNTHV